MRFVFIGVVFATATATAAAPMAAGCVGGACDTKAAASVDVSVVDAKGALQKDATVTFSVDEGAEQPAECVRGIAGSPCEAWAAGFEQSGSFTVKAVSADGTKTARKTVKVTADECHVVTQAVALTLQ